MDELSKLFELMQSVKKYLSWSILLPCCFTSTALLLMTQFVRNIIEPMYTTIRITLTLICLFSFAGLLYKAFSDLCAMLFTKFSTTQEKARRQKQITQQIQSLSQQERAVLEYVKSGDTCGIWVSELDSAVLTLLHKVLLERIGDTKCFADWPPNSDERASCILVVIPNEVLKFIT